MHDAGVTSAPTIWFATRAEAARAAEAPSRLHTGSSGLHAPDLRDGPPQFTVPFLIPTRRARQQSPGSAARSWRAHQNSNGDCGQITWLALRRQAAQGSKGSSEKNLTPERRC
jgi:hypothetical protein